MEQLHQTIVNFNQMLDYFIVFVFSIPVIVFGLLYFQNLYNTLMCINAENNHKQHMLRSKYGKIF